MTRNTDKAVTNITKKDLIDCVALYLNIKV